MHTDSSIAYETNAERFLRDRDSTSIGAEVIKLWCQGLSGGSHVIELGCGGGLPITRILHAAGLQLWAIDSSPTMVAAFQNRFPAVPVQCAKVQNCDFFGRTFHGVVAIGLLFLLSEGDQESLIDHIAAILVPGGRFLFSAPQQKCSWGDLSTGIECRSLGHLAYERILNGAGMQLVGSLVDEGENHYYDARKA